MKATDSILYKKIDTLLMDSYPLVVNFPKAEKFALAQEIKQAFYGMMRSVILASNMRYKRRQYQEEADAHLKLLLVLFGVAKQLRYITRKASARIQIRLEEIGKILGGWMKSNK